MAVWMKAFALWFAILILAMLNGALREKALIPAWGPAVAFLVSGIILSVCVFAVAFVGAPWFGRLSSGHWLLVGAFWVVVTVVFEFGFGRLIQNKPWPELLDAYYFKGGNIWPVVLLVTLISPFIAGKLRALALSPE